MSVEKSKIGDATDAVVIRGSGHTEAVGLEGFYTATCYDAQGNLKWSDEIKNLTTNDGRSVMLDTIFGNGGPGPTWYMGLKGTGAAAYTNTQDTHPGWLEVGGVNAPTYIGDRALMVMQPFTTPANPAVLSTGTPLNFAMTSSGTVAGAFANWGGNGAKDGVDGILFSVGDFTSGPKSVLNGDTIQVTWSVSAGG